MKNIGQQVIILEHGKIGPRIVLSVYSDNEQTGYIKRDGKQVKVQRVGFVDSRNLKQLWQVASV